MQGPVRASPSPPLQRPAQSRRATVASEADLASNEHTGERDGNEEHNEPGREYGYAPVLGGHPQVQPPGYVSMPASSGYFPNTSGARVVYHDDQFPPDFFYPRVQQGPLQPQYFAQPRNRNPSSSSPFYLGEAGRPSSRNRTLSSGSASGGDYYVQHVPGPGFYPRPRTFSAMSAGSVASANSSFYGTLASGVGSERTAVNTAGATFLEGHALLRDDSPSRGRGGNSQFAVASSIVDHSNNKSSVPSGAVGPNSQLDIAPPAFTADQDGRDTLDSTRISAQRVGGNIDSGRILVTASRAKPPRSRSSTPGSVGGKIPLQRPQQSRSGSLLPASPSPPLNQYQNDPDVDVLEPALELSLRGSAVDQTPGPVQRSHPPLQRPQHSQSQLRSGPPIQQATSNSREEIFPPLTLDQNEKIIGGESIVGEVLSTSPVDVLEEAAKDIDGESLPPMSRQPPSAIAQRRRTSSVVETISQFERLTSPPPALFVRTLTSPPPVPAPSTPSQPSPSVSQELGRITPSVIERKRSLGVLNADPAKFSSPKQRSPSFVGSANGSVLTRDSYSIGGSVAGSVSGTPLILDRDIEEESDVLDGGPSSDSAGREGSGIPQGPDLGESGVEEGLFQTESGPGENINNEKSNIAQGVSSDANREARTDNAPREIQKVANSVINLDLIKNGVVQSIHVEASGSLMSKAPDFQTILASDISLASLASSSQRIDGSVSPVSELGEEVVLMNSDEEARLPDTETVLDTSPITQTTFIPELPLVPPVFHGNQSPRKPRVEEALAAVEVSVPNTEPLYGSDEFANNLPQPLISSPTTAAGIILGGGTSTRPHSSDVHAYSEASDGPTFTPAQDAEELDVPEPIVRALRVGQHTADEMDSDITTNGGMEARPEGENVVLEDGTILVHLAGIRDAKAVGQARNASEAKGGDAIGDMVVAELGEAGGDGMETETGKSGIDVDTEQRAIGTSVDANGLLSEFKFTTPRPNTDFDVLAGSTFKPQGTTRDELVPSLRSLSDTATAEELTQAENVSAQAGGTDREAFSSRPVHEHTFVTPAGAHSGDDSSTTAHTSIPTVDDSPSVPPPDPVLVMSTVRRVNFASPIMTVASLDTPEIFTESSSTAHDAVIYLPGPVPRRSRRDTAGLLLRSVELPSHTPFSPTTSTSMAGEQARSDDVGDESLSGTCLLPRFSLPLQKR